MAPWLALHDCGRTLEMSITLEAWASLLLAWLQTSSRENSTGTLDYRVEVDPTTYDITVGGPLPPKRRKHYSVKGRQLTLKLRKSIYGLKKSSRNWYSLIDSFILGLSFTKSTFDGGIFLLCENGELVILAILHVDELPRELERFEHRQYITRW